MRKITVLLLSVWSISLTGQSILDRKVNFQIQESSTSQALVALSKSINQDIAFSDDFFNKKDKISFNGSTQSIGAILKRILKPYPKITFQTLGKRIILYQKSNYSISGFLADQASGERLIGGTIFVPEIQKGVTTNEYGFYSITLPEGRYSLRYQYLGYQTFGQSVELKQSIKKDIFLENNVELDPVIITANENSDQSTFFTTQQGGLKISPEWFDRIPSLGGSSDPIRGAQLLPGIQSGPDGLEGIFVRGGNNSQNLLLLDGVTIYLPYHLLGLFSVYNPLAIKSVNIYKGNFPARFGGRLSSVFDVRTKEGNINRWTGSLETNLLTANLLVEGPIKAEKGAILFSARQSYSGFLFNPFFKRTYFGTESEDISNRFYDINLKVNYTLNPKDRIYLSYYQNWDDLSGYNELTDEFIEASEVSLNWGNAMAALRWNHLFNDKLFSNTQITLSQFGSQYAVYEQFRDEEEEGEEEINDFFFNNIESANTEIGIQMDFDWIKKPGNTVRFGGALSVKTFNPDLTYFEGDDFDEEELERISNISSIEAFVEQEYFWATESHLYYEEEWTWKNRHRLKAGLRLSGFVSDEAPFFNLEPRLHYKYQIAPQLSFETGLSRMVQYLHSVSLSTIRLPIDLWIPANNDLLPEASWQFEARLDQQFSAKIRGFIQAYYKSMDNLYAFPENFSIEFEDYLAFLEQGSGKARGIETGLNFQNQSRSLNLSYAYTKTERQFPGVNSGEPFAFAFDQPHQIKLF
ncbi:MAG: TonB-dependent receptor, partial [Bacteroidota bacterium]